MTDADRQVVAPLVRAHFERSALEEGNDFTQYVRCSSLGMCPLRSVHRMMGRRPQWDVNSLLIFELGETIHGAIQRILQEHGARSIEQEYRDDTLQLIGHTDAILGDEVIELKSISPDARRYKRELPYPHHVRQVHGYMHLTGVRKARIVYVDKAYGLIDEYPVEWSDSLWLDIVLEVKRIHAMREIVARGNGGTPSELMSLLGSVPAWQCRRCPFYNQCAAGARVVEEAGRAGGH